jgi:hypothetical protein
MGIVTDDAKKVRYFKFTSALTYDELKAIFSDSANLSSIDYIGEDGVTAKTYQDCVKMLVISFVPDFKVDDNATVDIYTVTISTDAVAMALKTALEQQAMLSSTIDYILCEAIPTIVG